MSAEIKVRASFDGSQVKRGIDEIREKSSAWAGEMAVKFLSYAAILGAVSSAFQSLRRTAKEFGDVADRAARLNVSTADLQRIEFAATEAGLSAEKAGTLLDKLRVVMSAAGKDDRLRKSLEQAGVAADTIASNDPARALQEMGNALAGMTEPQRIAALKEIFGNRMAMDAFALIGKDFKKFKEDLASTPLLNELEVQRLAEADQLIERMFKRLNLVKAAIVSGVAGQSGVGQAALFGSNQSRLEEQARLMRERLSVNLGKVYDPSTRTFKDSGFFGPRNDSFTERLRFNTGEAQRETIGSLTKSAQDELRKIQSEQLVRSLESSGMNLPSILGAAKSGEMERELSNLRNVGGVKGIELVTPESLAAAAEAAAKAKAEAEAAGGGAAKVGAATGPSGSIVATSVQSVGGGGFAVASDIVVDRLDRIASASERSADALESRGEGEPGVEPGDI